ncbi:hypothetical protein I4U23_003403 [Adineta vaga]|nr:hypothetical protein I4U23_003403 [Adineta vaga]
MMMMISNENQFKLKSNLEIPIHFLCSSIQLVCIFSILGFQSVLTITKTCPFYTGIGYWSFPFLIIAPISIGIFLQKRTFIYSCLLIIIHFCSNLFATLIIIISFLVLIEQFGISCATTTDYSFALNISLITVSICLKFVLYGEIILIYNIARQSRKISVSFKKKYEILFDHSRRKIGRTLQLELGRFDDIDI